MTLLVSPHTMKATAIGKGTKRGRRFTKKSARHAPFLDYHHTTAPQGQSGLSVRRDLPILGALLLAFILTLILLMFGSLFIVIPSAPSPRDDSLSITTRTVILIGLEGFRYEYLASGRYAEAHPRLDGLITRGALAPMIPVFPARHAPNLWSLVTGLYPVHHGIMDDVMYDSKTETYWDVHNTSSRDAPDWYRGDPFWSTYSSYGGLSGSVGWLGSTVPKMSPNYTAPKEAEDQWSASQRVEQALAWLALPEEERPRFLALTMPDVYQAALEAGTDSQAVLEAIQEVDQALGQFEDGVNALEFATRDQVTWLIVSDHGMADTSEEQTIFLDDYIDLENDAEVINWGAFTTIRALKGRASQLLYQLQQVDHAQVLTPDTMPSRYHFSHSSLLGDVMLLCEEGWTVSSHARTTEMNYSQAADGYDPGYGSMQSFLLGVGDYFRASYVEATPQSPLHLYSLMATLLDVLPASSDGSWLKLCSMLDDKCG